MRSSAELTNQLSVGGPYGHVTELQRSDWSVRQKRTSYPTL